MSKWKSMMSSVEKARSRKIGSIRKIANLILENEKL